MAIITAKTREERSEKKSVIKPPARRMKINKKSEQNPQEPPMNEKIG